MSNWARAAGILLLFGVSFGFVEASIVVYLREVSIPYRTAAGVAARELFPLLPIAFLEQSAGLKALLRTELIREVMTLLMLAAVGLAIGRTPRQSAAAFCVAFGIWDIAFYLSLKALIDWPGSLITWDLLFLVPVPWVGPVLTPVIVSVTMIVGGLALLRSEWRGVEVPIGPWHWLGIVGGALAMIVAFTWDWRAMIAGAVPERFPWLPFAAGEALSVGAFLDAWRRRRPV